MPEPINFSNGKSTKVQSAPTKLNKTELKDFTYRQPQASKKAQLSANMQEKSPHIVNLSNK